MDLFFTENTGWHTEKRLIETFFKHRSTKSHRTQMHDEWFVCAKTNERIFCKPVRRRRIRTHGVKTSVRNSRSRNNCEGFRKASTPDIVKKYRINHARVFGKNIRRIKDETQSRRRGNRKQYRGWRPEVMKDDAVPPKTIFPLLFQQKTHTHNAKAEG